jgi:ATP-dependent Clp protease ATP-binding subunit ClpB
MTAVTKLDPKQLSDNVQSLSNWLRHRIVGQNAAIEELVRVYQKIESGLNPPDRPLAVLLFLGPTGVGKTAAVQALAESLLGSKNAFTKLDCAEFQHSHEIAKLIGAPPGYLGHNDADSKARLTQDALERHQCANCHINILLLDEIEKAHDSLFSLFLGILEGGTLTLGNGKKTDFSHTIIVFTSNLGSAEVDSTLRGDSLGFSPDGSTEAKQAKQIESISQAAVRRFFRPEFINRIDHTIVFHALDSASLRKILELELNIFQERLLRSDIKPVLTYTSRAKEYLLKKGSSAAYGARELKRTIEKEIVVPIGSLIVSKQIATGDRILVSCVQNGLNFSKIKAANS